MSDVKRLECGQYRCGLRKSKGDSASSECIELVESFHYDAALKRAEAAEVALLQVRKSMGLGLHSNDDLVEVAVAKEAELAQWDEKHAAVLTQLKAAEAALAVCSKGFDAMCLKFREANAALASRDEALREAQKAFRHIIKVSPIGGYIEEVAEDWLRDHAPTAAPTGETQHGE